MMADGKAYWRSNLTPFDMELCKMVQNLTGMECEPKNGGDHYYLVVDYSKHNSPDYISAILDAIRGRAGSRFIECQDSPEEKKCFCRISFAPDAKAQPTLMRSEHEPDYFQGDAYMGAYGETRRALKIERESIQRVLDFVGYGEFEMPKDGDGTLHFLNGAGRVMQHAPEHSYLIAENADLFLIVKAPEFESLFTKVEL